MSGHSEDPIAEESKRFFTFFNLSMLLVAITGIEIVIIYVTTFDGASIIGVLFATSIIKFIGVVTWFMHLKWDKILNTILFLMGLVIALFTFFAVIYMSDNTPVVEEFTVTEFEQEWSVDSNYSKGDYVKLNDSFYVSLVDLQSPSPSPTANDSASVWEKVNQGIPHQFKWKVSTGDLIEINSLKPENPFFHLYNPDVIDNIEGSLVSLLDKKASTEDFRIKVRSEAFWVENER